MNGSNPPKRSRRWVQFSLRTLLFVVLASGVFGLLGHATPIVLAQQNAPFETFLQQLQHENPSEYERIKRQWDKEHEVLGPLSTPRDGKEYYSVPVKGGPPTGVVLYFDVYTGRINPFSEAARRRKLDRIQGPYWVIVGVFTATWGLVMLVIRQSRNFVIRWDKSSVTLRPSKRDTGWRATLGPWGWCALFLGILLVVMGLIQRFGWL